MKNNRNGSIMTNKNSFNFSSNVLNITILSVDSGIYIINGGTLTKVYIFFISIKYFIDFQTNLC